MSQLRQQTLLAVTLASLGMSSVACSFSLASVYTSCWDGTVVGSGTPCPPMPPPAIVAETCHVVRQDCLVIDAASGLCKLTTPTTFDAIACGKSDVDACNKFCVNAGQATYPYTAPCKSTPSGVASVDKAFCNVPTTAGNFDLVCANSGRICTDLSTGTCTALATETSSGSRTQCLDPGHLTGMSFCDQFPADNGSLVPKGSRVLAGATYKPHAGSCFAPRALTVNDMSYGFPAGQSVPVTVAGQNLTFMTSGGRIVVTYACDNTGEFCHPYQIKDFWLGFNPINVGATAVTNVSLSNADLLGFNADGTLSTSGAGFRVSAALGGGSTLATYAKPQMQIKFTGSLGSAPFTLGSTFDLDIPFGGGLGFATAHVNLNLSGSTFNSSGAPGGIQINCGDNGAIGTFVADNDFSGGAGKTRNNIIDLTGVVSPAPMAVYQSQHYASPFTYTIPGLTPGSSHRIRLHFAETNPLNNTANKRKFSVAINGTTQISNLDLFATVGMNKAYIKEFTLNANSSGRYVLSFTATLDSATISAIEVL